MRNLLLVFLNIVLLLSACGREPSKGPAPEVSTATQSTLQPPAESTSKPSPAAELTSSEIPYTKDKLSYAGYSITVEHRTVRVEEFSADNEIAVVKKNGHTIGVYDAVRHPLGAFTKLALVPVLGDRYTQLVIEQTGPREWAYWVIALKPSFRVVFSNMYYPVDHEINLEDLDADGIQSKLLSFTQGS